MSAGTALPKNTPKPCPDCKRPHRHRENGSRWCQECIEKPTEAEQIMETDR